jgi:hypothetical protein
MLVDIRKVHTMVPRNRTLNVEKSSTLSSPLTHVKIDSGHAYAAISELYPAGLD